MKTIEDCIKSIIYGLKYKKNIVGGKMPDITRDIYLKLSDSARLYLEGTLSLAGNSQGHNGRSSILRMDENSELIVQGDFCFMYGADIQIFKNAKLKLGKNSFINSDCKIRCHKEISIGDNCALAHDITIMDSDAHELNGVRYTSQVVIGNHVWIGTRATILTGVKIGDNVVVAAGSVVKNDIPAGSLVAGCPAKVINNKIDWSL